MSEFNTKDWNLFEINFLALLWLALFIASPSTAITAFSIWVLFIVLVNVIHEYWFAYYGGVTISISVDTKAFEASITAVDAAMSNLMRDKNEMRLL